MQAEKEMLKLLKSKHPTAFDYLYNKYSPSLYGMILKLTPDITVATDILKRSFVMCWNNLDKYDFSNGRLFTCLMNIALQECAKELGQSKQILLQKLLPSAKQVNKKPVAASVLVPAY